MIAVVQNKTKQRHDAQTHLDGDVVMMNVVLGHFDLEVIGPQVDSLADGAEVGPRRTLELGLETGGTGTAGTRIRIPAPAAQRNRWAGAGGTAGRTGGRAARRATTGWAHGRHATATSARAAAAAAATDASRRHHVTDGTRRGAGRAIASRAADSWTAESGKFRI